LTAQFDGVLGTKCLGGSVEFATPLAWDVNSSMPDWDGNVHGHAQTPFAGKTTIMGADDAKAVLEFGEEGGKAYATLRMEDDTAVPAKTALPDLLDENCTYNIFGG